MEPLDRDAGREGASGSSPGARRPPSDRRQYEALAERGWLQMKRIAPGALAGLVVSARARGAARSPDRR